MTAQSIITAYESLRAEYAEYRAESIACGYDPVTFHDWAGEDCAKARAYDRMIDIDSQYYHAD